MEEDRRVIFIQTPPDKAVPMSKIQEIVTAFHRRCLDLEERISEQSLVVNSQETSNAMTAEIGNITKLLKEIDEARLESTKPLRTWTSVINAAFESHLITPLKSLKSTLNDSVVTWRRLESKRIAEENQKKAMEEQRLRDEQMAKMKANQPVEQVAPIVLKREKDMEKLETGFERTIWTAVIENPDLVPREWCRPDDVKIRKAIRESKGELQIPGVRNVEKVGVIGRS